MSETATLPPFDSRALRNALGRFATGVAIVTAVDGQGQPIGLTVNSFAAVSLAPPLVLWSLGNQSAYLDDFCKASHYCVNVLAADQEALSNRFASRMDDRFGEGEWTAGAGGAPRLAGCCATFEVKNTQQLPGGDHTVFIGEVVSCHEDPAPAPLLFFGGRYARLAAQ